MSKTPEELIPALRQYLKNDRSDFVAGYDIEEVNRLFAALKEANERLLDRVSELEGAAKDLRICQRAYMLDRGNDELGRAVGVAAEKLDELLREPANEG